MSSNEWTKCKLGDFIEVQNGYAFKADDFAETGMPIIKIKNLVLPYVSFEDAQYFNANVTDRLKQFLIKKGDILISMTGSHINQIASAVGKVSKYQFEKPALLNQRVGKVFVKNLKVADETYLFYFLSRFETQFELASSAGGSANQANISPTQIKNLLIHLPTLPEQNKIAHLLSSIDQKIENNLQTNQTLEEIARTIFKEWFVKGADEYWDKKTFDYLVKPKRGKNITKAEAIEGEYPVVAGGLEPSCYHNKANTSAPVVTISSSGANAGFVRLYHNSVWAADCSYIDKTITPYVFFSYMFLKINQQILFDKQVGTAQPHIYPSHIMEMDILNYPKTLIEKFDKVVEPLFEKIKENIEENETLKNLRDSLLPKLMSGEIDVKEHIPEVRKMV